MSLRTNRCYWGNATCKHTRMKAETMYSEGNLESSLLADFMVAVPSAPWAETPQVMLDHSL